MIRQTIVLIETFAMASLGCGLGTLTGIVAWVVAARLLP